MKNGNYKIVITPDMVSFYTENFLLEERSFVHHALMNREVSSILASSFLTGLMIAIYSFGVEIGILQMAGFITIFVLLFILLRSMVFKERVLRVDFIKDNEAIRVIRPGFLKKGMEEFSINEVKSLSVSRLIKNIKNRNALEFVKRISYQHGTPLDISEEEELYLLGIDMMDGSRKVIYVDRNIDMMNKLLRELERFAGFIKEKVVYA